MILRAAHVRKVPIARNGIATISLRNEMNVPIVCMEGMLREMPVHVHTCIAYRPNLLEKKGDFIEGHKHTFDHDSIVIRGAIHVRAKLPDGSIREGDWVAGQIVCILKDVEHTITALEDNTFFLCAYAHRSVNGDIVERHDEWGERAGAYV